MLKTALITMLAGLAGCAPRKTEVHREWFEEISLHRDLILQHGDSISPATETTIKSTLAGRDLKALADTADDWSLDTAGIQIDIPSLTNTTPYSFTIRSHRLPAIGDSLRFQSLRGEVHDTDQPEVVIQRFERVSGAPMQLVVSPDSLSLILVGIPFDSAFAPALPTHSRIMARKAAYYRLAFDGWILQGKTYIMEYRYAATTYDVETEGL